MMTCGSMRDLVAIITLAVIVVWLIAKSPTSGSGGQWEYDEIRREEGREP